MAWREPYLDDLLSQVEGRRKQLEATGKFGDLERQEYVSLLQRIEDKKRETLMTMDAAARQVEQDRIKGFSVEGGSQPFLGTKSRAAVAGLRTGQALTSGISAITRSVEDIVGLTPLGREEDPHRLSDYLKQVEHSLEPGDAYKFEMSDPIGEINRKGALGAAQDFALTGLPMGLGSMPA